jgi:hypothetical protein
MACPAPARLAAAASGEDAFATAHAADCTRCATTIAQQRELVSVARTMLRPPAPLSDQRRRALAAELMARSDAMTSPVRDPRVPISIAVGALAAAAIALVLVERRGSVHAVAPTIELAVVEAAPPISDRSVAPGDPAPVDVRRPAELFARDADFLREQRDWSDVVTLRAGELSIDARDREPVTVIAGDTRLRISRARVTVVARKNAIVTAHVFAGTAELTRGSERHLITAGEVWTPPTAAPEPTSPTASLDAFRAGWQALHAQRYDAAIAAFDRATDPVVAEDATFWAAIACERAAKTGEAATRLHTFLERFPASPRADAARAALARVEP